MKKVQKKFIPVALAALMGAVSVSPAFAGAQNGDINSDGNYNSNDIAALSDFIVTQGYSANNADLTNDGYVDVFDLCSLRNQINNPQSSSTIPDYGTKMNSSATMVADFTKGQSQYFIASDGWTNGKPFDCWWYKENTSLDNGMLTLTIGPERNPNDKNPDWDPAYSGAEYRTNDFYSYGYYETSMQAIKNDGVVSSFFTYTGESDGNPWDEIDIEVLGKDTTKVQFNYYTNGNGGHEFMYDLGFDASQGFHTYGFDWQPDHITWYIDGKPVYTANQDIPKTPGKIMMNTWPGRTVNEWLKEFNGKTPLSAHYQWVTFDKSSSSQPQQPTTQQQNPWEQPQNPWEQQSSKLTPTKSDNTMFDDFTTGSAKYFIASDGWTNGKPFDCWWYKENTSLSNGCLSLTIGPERNPNDKNPDWDPAYSGAEYRTNDFYSYGYYETSMKAIKNDGVVSSFFTYTGESDGNPWDEIDIEVLGKDTTKVQFNYYTNGQGGHEYMYDLGFDASQGFHKYGFDWQPDKITWYIDGKAVYSANQNIPKTPGKIMMNAWPGRTVDEWLKAFNGKTPLTAQYQWVAFNGSSNQGQQGQQQNPWDNPWGQQQNPWEQQGQQGQQTSGNGMNASATMVADFTKGQSQYFIASDGWTNGKPFDCWWYKENTSLSNGVLNLTIDRERNSNDKNPDWDPAYSGAEYRTNDFYGFGYYETCMKAIKNDGVVSSFFTYTGESDGNPWDEIDVEVLGKDTTKVQFNYYTNGQGGHEYMYDLGFDASQGFHRYGFDWQRDHITWYIDGKAVYTAYNNIPQTPGKIMMNTWPGRTVDDWLKAFNGRTPLTASYQYVTYNKQ